jgi:hypothetical protein
MAPPLHWLFISLLLAGCEVRLLDAGNNILGRSGQAPPGGGSSGSSSSSSTGSGPQQLQGDGSNVAVVEVEDRMTGKGYLHYTGCHAGALFLSFHSLTLWSSSMHGWKRRGLCYSPLE